MTPQEIISDDEIARVHGNANFGAMDPREVVNDGVRKTAVGYHCGSTQLHILRDHGLVTKPRPGSSDADLTKKGKAYARSIYRDTTPARAEAQDEQPDIAPYTEDLKGLKAAMQAEAQDEGAAGERSEAIQKLLEEAEDFTDRMTGQPWACEIIERLVEVVTSTSAHPYPTPAAGDDRVRIAGEALEKIEKGTYRRGDHRKIAEKALAALKSEAK